jgi:glycosyltransferase involved in cell wall biosynthesis
MRRVCHATRQHRFDSKEAYSYTTRSTFQNKKYSELVVKICIIGPTYPYRGGIAHYTTLLVQHLLAAGHQAQVYSYIRQYPRLLFPGKSDREPSLTALRVPCTYIIDPFNPLTWWHVFRRVQRDQPDLLVLQWWTPYWAPSLATIAWLIKRRTNIKLVFICHNVLPHEEHGSLDRWLAWLILRWGDAFIVHSEQDRKHLHALLRHAAVRQTNHPTYAAFQQLSSEQNQDATIPNRFDLVGKKALLFFGFVRPYKGLKYLIEALALARTYLPDLHLLVVGEFWEDKEIYVMQAEEAGLQDHITFIDEYVPNEQIGDYFRAADLLVLPYVSATQSGVIQMAFGFGLPVITTRVGGLHEVIADGKTGLLVPPQDPEALAAAIVRYFVEDFGTTMRAHIAAEQETGRFEWMKLVHTLEEIERQ